MYYTFNKALGDVDKGNGEEPGNGVAPVHILSSFDSSDKLTHRVVTPLSQYDSASPNRSFTLHSAPTPSELMFGTLQSGITPKTSVNTPPLALVASASTPRPLVQTRRSSPRNEKRNRSGSQDIISLIKVIMVQDQQRTEE